MRRQIMTRSEVDAAMAKLVLPTIDLVVTGKFIDEAYAIAVQYGGSLYDAIYLALAKSLSAELVTADLQMIAVARKSKITARLLA